MSADKVKEAVRDVNGTTVKGDSVITISSASFADDESILVSDLSGAADVFDMSTDASCDKSAITKSASNDDGASVFTFSDKEKEKIKRDYNVCGKRFERGSGARGIRNNVVETMPVSLEKYS